MSATLYDVLEVARTASPETLKVAYESLVGRYAIEKLDGLPQDLKVIAEDRLKAITKAYETLSDPLKRAAYDTEIGRTEGYVDGKNARELLNTRSTPSNTRILFSSIAGIIAESVTFLVLITGSYAVLYLAFFIVVGARLAGDFGAYSDRLLNSPWEFFGWVPGIGRLFLSAFVIVTQIFASYYAGHIIYASGERAALWISREFSRISLLVAPIIMIILLMRMTTTDVMFEQGSDVFTLLAMFGGLYYNYRHKTHMFSYNIKKNIDNMENISMGQNEAKKSLRKHFLDIVQLLAALAVLVVLVGLWQYKFR